MMTAVSAGHVAWVRKVAPVWLGRAQALEERWIGGDRAERGLLQRAGALRQIVAAMEAEIAGASAPADRGTAAYIALCTERVARAGPRLFEGVVINDGVISWRLRAHWMAELERLGAPIPPLRPFPMPAELMPGAAIAPVLPPPEAIPFTAGPQMEMF